MEICVLFRKEMMAYYRNKKMLALILIFVFFGVLSPLTAYFIPDIVAYFAQSQQILIEIPPPTYNDAIFQYTKNLSQMCVFILILMHMGIVSAEKEKGTAVFVLVKPVRRSHFVMAKFLTVFAVTALCTILAGVFAGFYTLLLFETLSIVDFVIQNVFLLLYILTVMSLTVMFSTVAKSYIAAGIFSFLVWVLFPVFTLSGKLAKFSPEALVKAASASPIIEFPFYAIITALAIMLISIIVAISAFQKWEPK